MFDQSGELLIAQQIKYFFFQQQKSYWDISLK